MQYGHFDNEKREYVIDRVDLPVSWTNYLGVKDLCVVVNHTAGGYMFYQSPEYHRVTRFRGNAVPMGPAGTLCVSEGCKGRRLLEHFLAAGGQTAGSGKIHLQTRHELHNL